jgi:hypothetical protein
MAQALQVSDESLKYSEGSMAQSVTRHLVVFLMVFCVVAPLQALRGQATDDYRSKTPLTGSWKSASSWERYNGSAWVDAGTYPTSTANQIDVLSGSTLTIGSALSVDQVVIYPGGTVINNSTLTVVAGSAPDLAVSGTMDNQGTLTLTGVMYVSGSFVNSGTWSGSTPWIRNGGTYKHNYATTAGTIPACNWEAGSTLEITGYTTSTELLSLVNNPVLWNFVWNCTSQTSVIPFPTDIGDVGGSLTIASTGSGSLVLNAESSDRSFWVAGNFVQTGGTFDLASGSGTTVIWAKGNVTLSGGTLTETGSGTRSRILVAHDIGNAPCQLTVGDGCTLANLVGITVFALRTATLTQDCNVDDAELLVEGTLHCGSYVVRGASFALGASATLCIGHPYGITETQVDGNIQTTSRSFDSQATYRYECAAGNSYTGDGVPSPVMKLVSANNGGSLYLEKDLVVTDSLILESPIQILQYSLTLGPSAGIAGSAHVGADHVGEFIRGISSIGNHTFPVGTEAVASPFTLDILAGSFGPGYVHVKVRGTKHPSNTSANDYITRYWSLSGSGFSGLSYDATFTYADADVVGTESAIFCGRYSGTSWTLGNQSVTATNTLGIDGQSGFSDFTGGEAGALPVQLADFVAHRVDGGTQLTWRTLSEINNFGFFVQRRTEPSVAFVDLVNGFIPGCGTTVEPRTYVFTDSVAPPGISYYRLRQVDLDGSEHALGELRVESEAATVEQALPVSFGLRQNFPNPFNPTTTVVYALPDRENVRLEIFDLLGRVVLVPVDEIQGPGVTSVHIDAANLTSGTYFYRLRAGRHAATKAMMVVR